MRKMERRCSVGGGKGERKNKGSRRENKKGEREERMKKRFMGGESMESKERR